MYNVPKRCVLAEFPDDADFLTLLDIEGVRYANIAKCQPGVEHWQPTHIETATQDGATRWVQAATAHQTA